MAKMTIMRGIPGSGKSTKAREISNLSTNTDCLIVSADDFFTSVEGEYNFKASRLKEAHAQCFKNAVFAVEMGMDVIVDNTNTTMWEISPYLLLAEAYRMEIEIIRINYDPNLATARTIHNVPYEKVIQMAKRMENLPSFWPKEIIIEGKDSNQVNDNISF